MICFIFMTTSKVTSALQYLYFMSNIELFVFHRGSNKAVVNEINVHIVIDLFIDFLTLLCQLRPHNLGISASVGFAYISIYQVHVKADPNLLFSFVIFDLIWILLHYLLFVKNNVYQELVIKFSVLFYIYCCLNLALVYLCIFLKLHAHFIYDILTNDRITVLWNFLSFVTLFCQKQRVFFQLLIYLLTPAYCMAPYFRQLFLNVVQNWQDHRHPLKIFILLKLF